MEQKTLWYIEAVHGFKMDRHSDSDTLKQKLLDRGYLSKVMPFDSKASTKPAWQCRKTIFHCDGNIVYCP